MKVKSVLIFLVALLLLLGGCSSSGKTDDPSKPNKPDTQEDSPKSDRPETIYCSELNVSQESKKDMDKAGVKITSSRFTYYEDALGQIEYYLIIEWQNNGKKPYQAMITNINLYDSSHNLVKRTPGAEAIYGIIYPGDKDYLYCRGYLFKEDIEKTGFDISKGLIPHMEGMIVFQDYWEGSYAIAEFETDTAKKTTDDGRVAFSGTITNPLEEDFKMVWIYYLMYDATGNIIAIQPQNVMDLKAKQTKDLDLSIVLNREITPDMVAEYRVLAKYWWTPLP